MSIVDISETTKAKSDQLNADDIIVGSITIEITGVRVIGGDQPVIIEYAGMNGKPYKPCKSMRRVLFLLWGKADFRGRKITLFNDPDVMWGGKKVGGLRIDSMSHIEKDSTVLLAVSKAIKAPYFVKKLEVEEPKNKVSAEEYTSFNNRLLDAITLDQLKEIGADIESCNYDDESRNGLMEIFTVANKRIKLSLKKD